MLECCWLVFKVPKGRKREKMKNFVFLFLVATSVAFFSACAKETPAPAEPESAIAQEADDILKKIEELNAEIKRLTEEFEKMNAIQSPVLRQPPSAPAESGDLFSATNPQVYLKRMDADLDAVERGENPMGSFSDWFAINAGHAFANGASKKEIDARTERLISLAKQGKFLSSYLERLMNDGGAKAVRDYVSTIIDEARLWAK